MTEVVAPVHPGAILQKEFLDLLGLSPLKLATHLNITENRLYRILREERPITAEIALRLSRFFDTSPWLWMNAQIRYDVAMCELEMGEQIEKDVVPVVAQLLKEEARA